MSKTRRNYASQKRALQPIQELGVIVKNQKTVRTTRLRPIQLELAHHIIAQDKKIRALQLSCKILNTRALRAETKLDGIRTHTRK